MDIILKTDDELSAFIIDEYPEVYREFGTEMNRTTKLNIFLERAAELGDVICKIHRRIPNATVWNQFRVLPMASPESPYHPDWYISRADIEKRAMDLLRRPGAPVILWGAERCGKTWLLRKLVSNIQEEEGLSARIALVHLDEIIRDRPIDSNQLFRNFGLHLIDAFENSEDWAVEWPRWLGEAWEQLGGPMRKLKWLVQQRLLPKCPNRLIIAIDGADAMVGSKFQNDFYGMLRGWSEGSLSPPFDQLRIIMAVSYSPVMLIEEVRQSPFNLTQPIQIDDFSIEELSDLAWRYALFWTKSEIQKVFELVGGHPYLSRLIMHSASQNGIPLLDIVNGTTDSSRSIFDPFLSRYKTALEEDDNAMAALCQIAQGNSVIRNVRVLHRLERAGLIVRDPARGIPRLRCLLYHRLLDRQ
jgi:hypothetical protein